MSDNRAPLGLVSFTLNGKPVQAAFEEGETLLEVLRDRLGVTSPKDGCAPQGQCGCCTVMIDGRALMSCIQGAQKAEGKSVVTLEGFSDRKRTILADAFVETGGMQCGFCIPGIMVKATQILDKNAATSRDSIAKKLNSHLCRCTGYTKILDAIELAGKRWPEGAPLPASKSPEATGVGTRTARYRGADLTLGEKPYVADMRVDGMAFSAFVFSKHARAVVRSIDLLGLKSQPGVVGILTAADVPGKRNVGLILPDWPIFVAEGETTRCVGDVLAVVVAEDARTARRVASQVEVDYDVLEPVTCPKKALEADAPVLHGDLRESNLVETSLLKRGDLAKAKAESVHVFSHTFVTQRIEHAFLEPESCLALPEGDGIRVYTQGQGVHEDQRQIAAMLGVEAEKVRVTLVSNGGAFGGKEDLSVQAQTALAATVFGRPVLTTLTRDESIRLHPKRHPIEMDYTIGADADGRLKFVQARMIGDTGAYASVGMKVLERATGHSCGPYVVDAVDVVGKTVYTNNVPCGAFRGFGANQAAFALEGMMDILAEAVGVDGYDIRERNILDPGGVFAAGQILDDGCGIRQTLEAVKDVYKGAQYAGISCGIKNTGIGNGMADTGRSLIKVEAGNKVSLYNGFTEMGQGLFTVIMQILCEETGLNPDQVRVETSTDFSVECGMTTASRATVLAGMATKRAAQKLALDLKTSNLSELEGRMYSGEYICDFTTKLGVGDDPNPVTHLTFGYATQVVILDDDGTLKKVVASHDVGKAINPTLCEGQIEGGVHMGLGYALTEDLSCENGAPVTTKIGELGILRAKHVPEIEVILIEVPDPIGPYGAKGVGEIGLVPTAGAVAGALFAYDGKRRFTLPMKDSPAARAILPKKRSRR